MPHEIIHKLKTGKLQNFNTYEKLNPPDINIKDSEVNSVLARYSQ